MKGVKVDLYFDVCVLRLQVVSEDFRGMKRVGELRGPGYLCFMFAR